MNNRIAIWNPALKSGGTTNLLAHLAEVILEEGRDLVLIDYANGWTANYLHGRGFAFQHVVYNDNKRTVVDCDVFIAILLHVKFLGSIIRLNDGTRCVFWCTHPDDGVKLLPSFNLYVRFPEMLRSKISSFLHPGFKGRLAVFLKEGLMRKGVVFMDRHTHLATMRFYKLCITPTIWPLVTADPAVEKRDFTDFPNLPIRITYLGRLTGFKVNTLIPLIRQLAGIRNSFVLNVIGDGPRKTDVEETAAECGMHGVNFLGHVDLKTLDHHLLKSDLVIAMGTSALESGKLGIPTLVVNGSYTLISEHALRVQWLHEVEPFFVGEIVDPKRVSLEGQSLPEILEALDKDQLHTIGQNCKNHWLKFHSKQALRDRFIGDIELNSFVWNSMTSDMIDKDFVSKAFLLGKKIIAK